MTIQAPDDLVNDHPRVNLDGLALYRVIQGDISANYGWGSPYPFSTPPSPPNTERCSALWRGYVATFRLHEQGSLELVSYCYQGGRTTQVHERLVGDFWLVMKRKFFGPRTYIPFQDGVIVEDQLAWVVEVPLEDRIRTDPHLAQLAADQAARATPCPYCGDPLPTAKAQQCFQCGMDWHDPTNIVRR